MKKQEELLGEIAEAMTAYQQAGQVTTEAIEKASPKKRQAKPEMMDFRTLALLSSLTITTITGGSYLYSSHQTALAENPDTRAIPASFFPDRCIDGLISTWPDGSPICSLLPA